MKQLKKFLITVALVFGAASSAYAYTETYVPMDPGAPGVFNTSWSIDGSMGSDASMHAAGAVFTDLFDFNVPDAQSISFSVSAFRFGVDLLSAPGSGYLLFSYADGSALSEGTAMTPFALSGGAVTLTSGTYALVIQGTYLVDGGTYVGSITGIPVAAVPEPANWLMLLAGLGAVAGVIRQRKQAA